MKIETKLALSYLKRNKRRSIVIIIGIIIQTILLTSSLILISSYKEYMVNTARSKGNWEARFSNITYEDALQIAADKNTKEISLSQKIGITQNLRKDDFGEIKFDLRSYDENALKNSNIHIVEGRLPKNSNEVIISITASYNNNLIEKVIVGEKLKLTINNKEKEYIVVRQN